HEHLTARLEDEEDVRQVQAEGVHHESRLRVHGARGARVELDVDLRRRALRLRRGARLAVALAVRVCLALRLQLATLAGERLCGGVALAVALHARTGGCLARSVA